jgi:hypothetical protein
MRYKHVLNRPDVFPSLSNTLSPMILEPYKPGSSFEVGDGTDVPVEPDAGAEVSFCAKAGPAVARANITIAQRTLGIFVLLALSELSIEPQRAHHSRSIALCVEFIAHILAE